MAALVGPHAKPANAATGRVLAPPASRAGLALICAILGVLTFGRLLWNGLGDDGGIGGLLRGPDDFTRMAQVVDWMDGQGWYDLVQRRIDPPEGVAMHLSRLADLPLAAAILMAEPWLGRAKALEAAALVVPPLLGGLFVGLFCWAAAPLVGHRRTLPLVLMVPALMVPIGQFHPGRVDHHGLQLLLAALAIGLLLRVLESNRSRTGASLGAAGGASWAIGLETLPLVAAIAVALGLAWALRGVRASALGAFGMGLFGAAATGLMLTLPPMDWAAAQCDRLSIAQLALAALVLTAGCGALLLERQLPQCGPMPRTALLGGLGMAGLASVAGLLPICVIAPYAGLPDELRYWFGSVAEAQSLLSLLAATPGNAIAMATLPLAALAFAGAQAMRPGSRDDRRWMALAALLLATGAAMAWQVRSAPQAGLAAAVALVPLAAEVNRRATDFTTLLGRLAARLSLPIFCLALLTAPQWTARTFATPARPPEEPCELQPALAVLNDPGEFGATPRTIAAPIDLGPELLLLTAHSVLAAPVHRNVRGLRDHRRLFGGTEQEARGIVEARDVAAILFCSRYAPFTNHPNRPGYLNERLAAGNPPPWLAPVLLRDGMGLYRVRPPKSRDGGAHRN